MTLPSLGATAEIQATVLDQYGDTMPAYPVSWASANPAVAAIRSVGLIEAVSNGLTTVTASAGSASGDVSVVVQQVPTSLELNPSSVSFSFIGDTVRIKPFARDALHNGVAHPPVSWTSSDPSVVTVDTAGLATSVGEGAATVTATVGDVTSNAAVTVALNGPSITTDTLPFALTGHSYFQTLAADGEARNFAWTLVGGSLPPGLSLDLDGTLYGTPTQAGSSTFEVQALDRVAGQASTRTLSLVVYCDPALCLAPAYKTWFDGSYDYGGPGLALSAAAFQHASPWNNGGMLVLGGIPRPAIENRSDAAFHENFTLAWDSSYAAFADAAGALQALDVPQIGGTLNSGLTASYRAFALFVQGMSLATVAVLYDQGFIQYGPGAGSPHLVGYQDVMSEALRLFDEAAAVAGGTTFDIPDDWIGAWVSSERLVRIIHSMKARYRVAVARTPEERAAVDWGAVITDVDAGVTSSFAQPVGYNYKWYPQVVDYGTDSGWSEMPYWIYGMADQSDNDWRWLTTPFKQKVANPDTGPILIQTPDLRFPQGSTVQEQQAHPGKYFILPDDYADVWKHPERGTWRWSYYRNGRYPPARAAADFEYQEINLVEMDLLKAEALYRLGDRAGAAALVNKTRTANGLSAAEADGTNTSCVPKLTSRLCGGLLEMLKWEKRMEVNMQGLFGAPWFFDSRGWGDLWIGTPLEFPVPCEVLQSLGRACYTFGGAGGDEAAPLSSYAWPGEG